MKDWLKSQKQCPPTKTKDCMKYRHWRFKKDKDGTVLVQMRTSPIVSYTSEPWQGLEPNSVSHNMFRKGVPNLVHDMQRGVIPHCARREEPLKQAYVDLVLAGIEKLQRILGQGKLSDADVDSLHALAKSAVAKPLSFSWDPQRVTELFGKGSHGPQIVYPSGGGNYRTLPFQVLVGSFYLVQPRATTSTKPRNLQIFSTHTFSLFVLSDRRSTNQEQWLPFLDCRSRLPR